MFLTVKGAGGMTVKCGNGQFLASNMHEWICPYRKVEAIDVISDNDQTRLLLYAGLEFILDAFHRVNPRHASTSSASFRDFRSLPGT